jgi:hypothetical protein
MALPKPRPSIRIQKLQVTRTLDSQLAALYVYLQCSRGYVSIRAGIFKATRPRAAPQSQPPTPPIELRRPPSRLDQQAFAAWYGRYPRLRMVRDKSGQLALELIAEFPWRHTKDTRRASVEPCQAPWKSEG